MTDARASSSARLVLLTVLALSLLALGLQVAVVRPRLWPAGIGATLSGETVLASLSEPRTVAQIRPPDVAGVRGTPREITMVAPAGEARQRELTPGTPIDLVLDRAESLRPTAQVSARFPATPEAVLDIWRQAYRRGPTGDVPITNRTTGKTLLLPSVAVWDLDPAVRSLWLRQHLGVLVQTAAFVAGALVLAFLGARGMTATLMTLAMVATAIASGGPMFGAELSVPVVGNLLLIFGWLITPLTFPVIGLAVLYFPTRAAILDRHRWIYPAIAAVAAPMLVISLLAAAFLLGVDGARAPLAWSAMHGWIFDASFALALAVNVAIVIEGIGRYRHNLDVSERRRIQLVVFSGVPAVFAYAIKAGVPLLSSLAGEPVELPWSIEAVLQAIVVTPAIALPYAVAVKHIFSPRTVVRRGVQYALARRSLSILVALPVAVLVFSLLSERDQPLADIVLERPWFYVISLGLAALGFRYRVEAQRWLDKQFFRAEYDAREILVSLANRVPFETDPAQLVALVLTQIDNALHPESIAVLAGEDATLEVVSALRCDMQPLRLDGGVATLLRWSDDPLEIFLDDERSPAARLPAADRAWLATSGMSLLVPIFGGTAEGRSLEGLIALGRRRSEEPYTQEDRRLLSGIAAQLSVAHDLSRLRRRVSSATDRQMLTPAVTPTMVAGTNVGNAPALAMCPECHRCFDVGAFTDTGPLSRCPDDSVPLQPVMGMPTVVDGKYRVDAVVGRGGMGAVFRARDLRLERDVAVKVVRAETMANPESRARFQREAQIVARLQHPGIVAIFDYGTLAHGAAFLVMEFVAGEDLRHLLKREHKLPPARAIELVGGIAAGVDAAHRAGVLHRDLKPENILLPSNGAGPKVLDFGVAKMTGTGTGEAGVTLTQGVTIVGTPAYMAPEQLRGEPLDGRADVFSLGVMTYEALTGRLPFGGGSFFDVGMKQAEGALRLEFGEVGPALAHALGIALSLNRDERPATAGAFVELLRPALPRGL
jgi:eukaryotic-like serine/threonine-protein kinase